MLCNDIIKKQWCSGLEGEKKKAGPDPPPIEIKEDFAIDFGEERVLDTICVQFIFTFAYPNDLNCNQ